MATFRQRNGRWQAIIRRVDLKASKSFDRLVDAKAWARAQERAADVGTYQGGKPTGTLTPLIERYERELWQAKRWGANKAYELTVLKRDLGSRLLETLSSGQILAYARGLDMEPSTRANRLAYLKEVLRVARDLWGLPVPLAAVEAAIAAGRRHGLLGKSNSRDRRPTTDELAAIIDYAKDREGQIDLTAVVRVLSVMPLRLGELVGIEWDDAVPERRSVILRGRKHPDIREREKPQEVPLIAFRGVDTFALVFDRPRYMTAPRSCPAIATGRSWPSTTRGSIRRRCTRRSSGWGSPVRWVGEGMQAIFPQPSR